MFMPKDVASILGVKPHFIINLVEKKMIVPAINICGRGKTRQYSYDNIVQIYLFKQLSICGISHHKISKIINCFTDDRGKTTLPTSYQMESVYFKLTIDMMSLIDNIHKMVSDYEG